MNPIDWYPWGQEAFARAEQLDIPIFLSIGYSACHWCHVMERECFEDTEVAGELNAHFVCIKVDREERPDVDEAYMAATQLMSGRGGWPLSAFLTPDRKPFFAGTYFPKHDRGRQPGLLSICTQLAHAWLHRREEVMSAANEITRGLERSLLGAVPASAELITQDGLDRGAIERVVEAWIEDYDLENGGFGKAPKFPPHTGMDFLSLFALRPDADEERCASALGIAVTTAYRMALGGIHDQVGGGFHRYSTDAEWKLPHFEKMLCDNALILANFSQILSIVHGTSPIAEAEIERASRGILNWIERELRADDGLIYSALDADSEGEEGRFYVWTEGELRESLGEQATEFCSAYGVQSQGNFVDEASGRNMGVNVLFLRDAPSQPFDRELEILREVRSHRIPPATDDKCLVGWNGLAIEGFALAGAVDLALGAALAILTIEGSHGRLPRHITKSNPHGEGYLEDYAYFAQALIQLSALLSYAEQTGVADPNWPSSSTIRSHADRLVLEMVQKFYDDDEGGFFATSSHHERLFGPTKPVFDQPLPSGNAVAIRCLFEIGDRDRAIQSLCTLSGWMERAPLATAALYSVCMRFLPYRDGALVAGESSLDRLPNPRQQVVIELDSKSLEANAEGVAKGVVNISIPPGLHLNSSQPIAKWLTPTRIEIVPLKAGIEYPPAVDEAYEGDVQIPFTVYLPTGVSGAEFELLISFQACTDQECLAPASRSFAGIVRRLAP